MSAPEREQDLPSAPAGRVFASTHWSVVLSAADSSAPHAQESLEKLCRAYWYPLYAYVRHRGYEPHDAQDLTQEFFLRLLDKHYLAQVDRRKGKFRSFLLVAVNHFLANEWDRAKAAKRGGRVTFVSFDEAIAEESLQLENTAGASPEKIFERRWAMTILDQVIARLRKEFDDAGKAEEFAALKMFLMGEKSSASYADLARRFQTTEAALKMAVQRMRHRCGELLREEIANTVTTPQQVEEEVRLLFAALGG